MNSWIIETLGWTLLHSLWQIAFVALILFVALRVLREFSANSRYLASIFALMFSLFLPIATFVYLSNTANIEVKPIQQPLSNLNIEPSFQSANPQTLPKDVPFSPVNYPAIAETSLSSTIPFLPILVGFWLIGVLIFSVRLVGGVWAVHLYKTRKVSAVETHWQEKFDELYASLQIRQKVKFLQSQMVQMPVVIGWLKPVVLVPTSAFLQISPKELETILIHELTHIQRNDYLINLVQSLVEILFFFHPCVWWISAQIRTEREFAVDETVSQIFETERFVYATALANLEESRTVAPILAMAADRGNLMKRIEKILNGSRKISSKNVSIWSAVFAVTFVVGVVAGIYWLQMNHFEKPKNGRKVAVIINSYRNKDNQVDYENILKFQKQYDIPTTWIINSELIDTLKQNGSAREFFRKAKETNSNFILNIPNMDHTIYIDGLDSYITFWKERIQFVNSNLAEYDDKLTFYTTYSTQIPQPMEGYLKENQISFTSLRERLYGTHLFDFAYEKNCIKVEKISACRETKENEKSEIREKYIQFNREIFEFRSNYSKETFGVEIPQILSLTTNDLTNDSADEILKMLKNTKSEFVPLEEVMSNEIFKKLENPSSEHKNFHFKKFEISKKYSVKPFLNSDKSMDESLKKAEENLKKNFNVNITTKDLKPKAQ